MLKLQYGYSLPERDRSPGAVPVIGSAGVVGYNMRATNAGPGIVVGRKGSIGSVTYSACDFTPIDTTYFVVPMDGKVDLRWVYHLLTHEDFSRLNRATGIPGLNRDDVYSLRRPLPPICEQRCIAKFLDAISAAIARTEAVIFTTEHLREALLHQCFAHGLPGWHTTWKEVPGGDKAPAAWKVVRLSDVAEVTGGSTPSRSVPEFWGHGIPWVTPSELTQRPGKYLHVTSESITDKGLASTGQKLIPAGSVLLTSRATIGLTAINVVPVATNQGFQNLVAKSGIHNLWLYFYIQTMKQELRRRASGSTFREVSRSAVRSLPMLLPSLAEQRCIAAVLHSIDTAIEQLLQERQRLQLLKASTAAALLTGQLRACPGTHEHRLEKH